MNNREFWIPVLYGGLITPICYLLGGLFSGGGHSLYPMIFFFPYAMLLSLLVQNVSWITALPFFALQFPLYGAAFGMAKVRGGFRPVVAGIAVAHFLIMMVGFAVEYRQQYQ